MPDLSGVGHGFLHWISLIIWSQTTSTGLVAPPQVLVDKCGDSSVSELILDERNTRKDGVGQPQGFQWQQAAP